MTSRAAALARQRTGRPAALARQRTGRPAAHSRCVPEQLQRLYVVAAWVPCAQTITIGALGPVLFRRGWYAYVGSAQRGRRARVARHMRADKPLRWHADYLFVRFPASRAWLIDVAAVRAECAVAATRSTDSIRAECLLAEALEAATAAREPAAARGSAAARWSAAGPSRPAPLAFGASDCGCAGHLVFSPTLAGLRAAVVTAAASLSASDISHTQRGILAVG